MSAEVFFFGVRGAGEGRHANRSVWLSGRHCSSSINDLYRISSRSAGIISYSHTSLFWYAINNHLILDLKKIKS